MNLRWFCGGFRRESRAAYQRKTATQSCISWSISTNARSVVYIASERKKSRGTFITYCRFGYPRPTCESASLRSMDECLKSTHRQMYKLPRSPQEIRINNYNPLLLMLWKANMDIQFIGESSLAIGQYVTGYMTKAEKSNMQEVWQEVSSHQTIYSKL